MYDAGRAAGLPDGAIGWMTTVTLEGTQELMKQREVSVILATGGMGLVRAAYSAGKPAYGVGPGNAPCYIEQSADLAKAAATSSTASASTTACSARRRTRWSSIEAVDGEVRRQFQAQRRPLPVRAPRPTRSPRRWSRRSDCPIRRWSASRRRTSPRKSGSSVPPGTRALLVELKGVGRDYPLSIEKLCPVLSYYVVKDWREGCERCKEILRYGGMGHTMSIHSRNEQVILEFGLHKPAYRICVNTPTTLGAIGFTTGLDPAMTLGCGGFGGNITSDNISPRHLLNIKRLAYEIRAGTRCTVRRCAGASGAPVRRHAGASRASAPHAAPGARQAGAGTHRGRVADAPHRRSSWRRAASRGARHRRTVGTVAPAPHLAPAAPAAPVAPGHQRYRSRSSAKTMCAML